MAKYYGRPESIQPRTSNAGYIQRVHDVDQTNDTVAIWGDPQGFAQRRNGGCVAVNGNQMTVMTPALLIGY